jgi:hypothetical protein
MLKNLTAAAAIAVALVSTQAALASSVDQRVDQIMRHFYSLTDDQRDALSQKSISDKRHQCWKDLDPNLRNPLDQGVSNLCFATSIVLHCVDIQVGEAGAENQDVAEFCQWIKDTTPRRPQ